MSDMRWSLVGVLLVQAPAIVGMVRYGRRTGQWPSETSWGLLIGGLWFWGMLFWKLG